MMKFYEKICVFFISGLLIFIPTTPRGFVWQAETGGRTLLELTSIVFFLSDFFLIGLFLLSLLRFLLDTDYQTHLTDSISEIVKKHGGLFWVLLILWAMFSIAWARESRLVQYAVFRLILEVSLAFVVADLVRHTPASQVYLMNALLIGAAIQSVVAIAQVISGDAIGLHALGELPADEYQASVLRGYGLSVNPNNLSGYLLVALLAGYLLLDIGRDISRPYTIFRRDTLQGVRVILPLIFLGLLATQSRTAILSLVVVMSFSRWDDTGFKRLNILLRPYKLPRRDGIHTVHENSDLKIRRLKPLIPLLLAGLILIGLLIWRADSVSITDRLFFAYDDTLTILEKSPWRGIGANHLMVEISHLHPFNTQILLPAHNAFLMVWAELGVVGVGLVVMTFWPALRQPTPWRFCLLAVALVMLFDFYFWGDFRMRLLWLFVVGMMWGDLLPTVFIPSAADTSK